MKILRAVWPWLGAVAVLGGCQTNMKAVIAQYEQVTPTRYEGAVAVVLKSEETAQVDDKGESAVMTTFKRVKLLDRKALDCQNEGAENCRLQRLACYDETWMEVESVEARTITPEGEVLEVKPEEVVDVTRTTWQVPDMGMRCKVWQVKGAVPGAILEERVKIRAKQLLGLGGTILQDLDPVLEVSFTVDAPDSFAYKWKAYNVDVQPTEERKGNRILRTWTAHDLPALLLEEDMVPPDDVAAKLVITTEYSSALGEFKACRAIKTWEDMGNCWLEMLKKPQEVSPVVQEVIDSLAAKAKTETEKLQAVWRYMNNNVRYVGLERGLQGLIPLPVDVVCSKKYGDCKAVAGLISVLCRGLGLKADPILIGTRNALGQLDAEMVGPFFFNHSIARVEADGQVYWMDATTRDFAWNTTPFPDQGVEVVVARPGAPFLDKIPVEPPERNRYEAKLVFTPGEGGVASLAIQARFVGNQAGRLRSYANQVTAEAFDKAVEGTLAEAYPRFQVKERSFAGKDDASAPFEVSLKAELEKVLQPTGEGYSFEVKLPFRSDVFDSFSLSKRRYPVDLGFLATNSARFEVVIPAGMTPVLPKNVMFEDEFVKVERLTQIENDRVVSQLEFAYKQLIIPPEQYARARESFQKALTASSWVLVFEPAKKKSA